LIFPESKIIFIHIPKTGGTSIESMLLSAGLEKPVSIGVHHTMQRVYDKYVNVPEDDEDALRISLPEFHLFTVARNPWDRYASMYVHDLKAYDDKKTKKPPLEIEEYMEKSVQETFFRMIEINGMIPDNLMIIDFDSFAKDTKHVFKQMGLDVPVLHENTKEKSYKIVHNEILANPVFQQRVRDMCAAEIELFGYELPEIP
jgi:hypothetical protein